MVFHRRCPQQSLIAVREDKIGKLTDYISVIPFGAAIADEDPRTTTDTPDDDDDIKTPDTPDPFESPWD